MELPVTLQRSDFKNKSGPRLSEKVAVPGGHLAVSSHGEGPAVIFLHGGPGDTHHYMKRMAEPLFEKFTCIFFDQRGTGGSNDFERIPQRFAVEFLFEDLIAIQRHFGIQSPLLVGHSWGAMYALYSCLQFPTNFKRAALLNMGPLDHKFETLMSQRLLMNLNSEEQSKWQQLRSARNQARDRGEQERVAELDRDLMQLRVKTWVVNPGLRESFLEEYFEDPPPDRQINKWIWEGQLGWFNWSKVKENQTPLWICTGAQDSVPPGQAQRLRDATTDGQITVFDQCGHLPWLEHPREFYARLTQFLETY